MTFVFLGAPADSVLRGGGAEKAPTRLRELGLAQALRRDAGDLPVKIRGDERDPKTGLLGRIRCIGYDTHASLSRGSVDGARRQAFVCGGCCSILPGCLSAARDRFGRLGLVYVDGHQDLYDGQTSTTGEAADMPLGVAIGEGPLEWVTATGGAGVMAADTHLLGPRDQAAAASARAVSAETRGITVRPLEAIRVTGAEIVGINVRNLVHNRGRYWLHLDVDVLDSVLFPATGYPQPDGLSFEELESLLAPLASDDLVGMTPGLLQPREGLRSAGRGSACRVT